VSKKAVVSVANITPSVVAWAIQRSELSPDAIAKKLKISPEQLASWQRDVPPPYEKAEQLADLVGVPFGAFYLQSPPVDEVPLPDMRSMDRSYKPSANFRRLLDDVLLRQDWYRDLVTETRAEPLSFVDKFSVRSSVNDVAEDIRDTLRLVSGTRRRVYGWDARRHWSRPVRKVMYAKA
jgi:transcriptional regulator with XRE-family HTH domain